MKKTEMVRSVVNAGIEVKRSNKEIGSSLEADIEFLDKRLQEEEKHKKNEGRKCFIEPSTGLDT